MDFICSDGPTKDAIKAIATKIQEQIKEEAAAAAKGPGADSGAPKADGTPLDDGPKLDGGARKKAGKKAVKKAPAAKTNPKKTGQKHKHTNGREYVVYEGARGGKFYKVDDKKFYL